LPVGLWFLTPSIPLGGSEFWNECEVASKASAANQGVYLGGCAVGECNGVLSHEFFHIMLGYDGTVFKMRAQVVGDRWLVTHDLVRRVYSPFGLKLERLLGERLYHHVEESFRGDR